MQASYSDCHASQGTRSPGSIMACVRCLYKSVVLVASTARGRETATVVQASCYGQPSLDCHASLDHAGLLCGHYLVP
jgi:hypothetical protein